MSATAVLLLDAVLTLLAVAIPLSPGIVACYTMYWPSTTE